MIQVSEIWDETKKILGNCTDAVAYKKLNRAIEILANKSDWDPMVGDVDIAACNVDCKDRLVALPREVEVPLAISYGPYPALGRDRLFQFHLNGPGGHCTCVDWRWWEDAAESPIMKDLKTPSALAGIAESDMDVGRVMTVYGFDANGQEIRTEIDEVMTLGYPVTLQASYMPDPLAPVFARISRVAKPESTGPVKLWSVLGTSLETLLAVYAWDDTEPFFRRMRIDRSSEVVRIHFRRRNFAVRNQTDLIPLHSAEAVVMMLQALRAYTDREFDIAMACEATAVRWLTEEQSSRTPANYAPMQVLDKPNYDDHIN